MRVLIFVIALMIASASYAQDPAFVYDDHGKRDPFVPLVSSAGMVIAYDADLAVNDLILEGIVADAKGDNVAIVNDKVVRPHDHIGPYIVDVITSNHVEFLKGTQRFVLGLKKGANP